jgi:hypothetical protein
VPKVGGHFWVYLNWALGLRAQGCRVVWLEAAPAKADAEKLASDLRARLAAYGLADAVALWQADAARPTPEGCVDLEEAGEADLLLNLAYGLPEAFVRRFRRSALLDIDPGLTQVWLSQDQIQLPSHDLYFTIGETVGRPGARFSDCGLDWHYTPPCVALDWWPVRRAEEAACFTTVSNWYMDEWVEDDDGWYINDKRSGFLPFLDLPRRTQVPLELALCLKSDEDAWQTLPAHGWRVRDAWDLTGTPEDYQRYIQQSLGEFSCVKPSCVRLQNAWISDRTLCYLASGKPAIVQHTGPSDVLPDASGLFRFRDLDEAARCLEQVATNYEEQCGRARALAEELFDARKVARRLLERALA